MKQVARILIVSLVGIFISYQILSSLDHISMFDAIGDSFFGIAAAITFFTVVFYDKKQFDRTKKWDSFIATFAGVAILVGHILIVRNFKQRDNIPSQIYCVSKIFDFNGISIDFRKDGTYKLTSWCLGADIYRGKFSIKDSIITIDKFKIENAIVSNRFVIRQDGNIDSMGKQAKSIYQIDQQGRIINGSEDFRVIDDLKK